MKAATIRTLLILCALGVPSSGQQKTYNWIPGNDETVRLDPGYYYIDSAYQPAPGTRSVHVDIDAQQPVTLAMVTAREWDEATGHPEIMGSMNLLCVQQHVMQATYTCDLPWGVPTRLLVRDERGERGYVAIGEMTRSRDLDRQQAPPQSANDPRPGNSNVDRDRERHDVDRAIGAGVDAVLGRARQRFSYPNDVRIEYYDWTCTTNCNLPDPPRPKLFDWVPGDTVVNRLDPGEFFHGSIIEPGATDRVYHFDLEARWPVTVAVVPSGDWYDAINGQFGKSLDNINYFCLQEHVVKTTFTCKINYANTSLFMVIVDERAPLPVDQYLQSQAVKQSPVQGAAQPTTQATARVVAAPVIGQNPVPKTNQPAAQPSAQKPALVERTLSEISSASSPGAAPSATVASAGAPGSYPARPFLAPNEVRRLGYLWRCVDACDQPDYGWGFQVRESYTLSNAFKLYGATVIPDHDGEQVNIHVKSPVPMAVAMVRAKVASRLYSEPDKFEATIENSACVQRGVQDSAFDCTFNIADGPQSLVLLPEAGADIPPHKKAEVAVQAFQCVDNCRTPSFQWVSQVHEKYHPTSILKTYGSFTADFNGAQVSIKIKSPVPVAAAMLPAREAGQLYGKRDMFDAEVKNSSCQQRNVQDSIFQCTLDVADGPQSLVVLPEPGYNLPRDKKTEVEIQAMKCVARCDSLGK
jgi:hypothetical protein